MSIPRHRRRALSIAAVSLLAAGAAAVPAQAAPFEQVSRGNDFTGWSPFMSFQPSVAASDSGRYAIFQQTQFDGVSGSSRFYLRDIVTNVSHQIGSNDLQQIYGIDKSETKALGRELVGNTQRLVLLSAIGLPTQVLATFPKDVIVYAALSGDAKTVAYSTSSPGGVDSLNTIKVATKVVTKLSDRREPIGPRSLSDDGRVLTGEGFAYVNGVRTDLPGSGVVSPDGSVVVYGASASSAPNERVLTFRNTATGATQTRAYPAGAEGAPISWIAPDGSKLVVSTLGDDGYVAKQLDVATSQWSTFGGSYTSAIQSWLTSDWDNVASPISRNGKYAVLGYSTLLGANVHQSAIVNLSGGDLPGSQEALSASSYVTVLPPSPACTNPQPSTLQLRLVQPASWLPKPRRATVTVKLYNGGGETTKTFTSATAWNAEPQPQEITVPPQVKSYTVRASVIDDQGRYTHTAETFKVNCNPWEG